MNSGGGSGGALPGTNDSPECEADRLCLGCCSAHKGQAETISALSPHPKFKGPSHSPSARDSRHKFRMHASEAMKYCALRGRGYVFRILWYQTSWLESYKRTDKRRSESIHPTPRYHQGPRRSVSQILMMESCEQWRSLRETPYGSSKALRYLSFPKATL